MKTAQSIFDTVLQAMSIPIEKKSCKTCKHFASCSFLEKEVKCYKMWGWEAKD